MIERDLQLLMKSKGWHYDKFRQCYDLYFLDKVFYSLSAMIVEEANSDLLNLLNETMEKVKYDLSQQLAKKIIDVL